MINILVLYDTRSGNTKEMAEAVSKGSDELDYTKVRMMRVDEAESSDVEWCHGLAVGTPTHCGLLTWKLKRFFDDEILDIWGNIDGKIGTAFSTSGGLGGGNELASTSVLNILMNYGFLGFGLTDYASEDVTGHYGAVAVDSPSESEREMCKILGKRLAEYSKKIFG
ncbi:MAG: flavodoxin family protein [Candidatus Hadarchaeia archaeon]